MYNEVNYNDYLKTLIQTTLASYPKQIIRSIADLPIVGVGSVRQELGKVDLEFFAKAYFPEYFEFETPHFHKVAYGEISKILNKAPCSTRLVRAWPRGNAKSTIYNFFTPCNAALYGKRKFVVQVSDSETQAESFLSDIKHAFENNPRIVEDFGDVRGTSWRSDLISIKATNNEIVWLAAAGAGSSVRGLRKAESRPDMIICDDLESDATTLTIERINKMHNWFQRVLMNLGTATTDIIVIGTVIAYESLLDKLLKSPTWDTHKLQAVTSWSTSPLWEDWTKMYTDMTYTKEEREAHANSFFKANEFEMLKDVEVLWPDGKPYIELMKIYVGIGEAAFYAEHQNDPVNLEECLFKPEWLSYYTDEELDSVRITEVYGALDPSLGRTRLSDFSAIVILGKGDNGFLYVLDAVIERMNPDRIIATLLQKAKEFSFTRFAVEVNQWQDLLRLMLIDRSIKEGIYLPIVELRHNKDKVIRVQSMLPYIKNGYVKFKREHTLLNSQLLGFPKLRYDDGPDALEMVVRIVGAGPSIEPMLTGRSNRNIMYDEDDGIKARHFFI